LGGGKALVATAEALGVPRFAKSIKEGLKASPALQWALQGVAGRCRALQGVVLSWATLTAIGVVFCCFGVERGGRRVGKQFDIVTLMGGKR
jgi:hypothetical protein